MRLFNIGGEGQLLVGAITAASAGLYFGGRGGPSAFAIAAMVVAGCAGGAAWALIPGILRAFFKTNEIITSLMLNYVAAYLLTYLIFNTESYWRETEGFNASVFPTGKTLPDSALWPGATIHARRLVQYDSMNRIERVEAAHKIIVMPLCGPIDAQGLIDRRIEVAERDRPIGHVSSVFVACAYNVASLNPATSEQQRPAVGPVIASGILVDHRRSAELTGDNHHRGFQQPSLVEILHQGREALVQYRTQVFTKTLVIGTVSVPLIGLISRSGNEPASGFHQPSS